MPSSKVATKTKATPANKLTKKQAVSPAKTSTTSSEPIAKPVDKVATKKSKTKSSSKTVTTDNTETVTSTTPAVDQVTQVDDFKAPDFITQTPPHNLHLNRFQNVVKCIITLHKIPDQSIKFEPTTTHIYLDTFKFSKKFLLRVPYPEGVEVDPEHVEAVLENGVLRCDFPITKDPHRPKNYDKVIQRRYQLDSMDKKKRKHFLAQERDSKEKVAAKKQKKAAAKKANATDNDDAHTPDSSSDVAQPQQQQQKKRKQSPVADDNPAPSKKRFMDNSAAALSLAKEINREQEQKAKDKAEKEYQKLSFSTKKKLERRERREGVLAAKKAKKSEMDKLMSSKDKRKQIKEKKRKQNEENNKRVSFDDNE